MVMVLSDAYWVVSGKGWSPSNATHCMPRSRGGERETTFIKWVLLSLVAHAIKAIVVRSSGNRPSMSRRSGEMWAVR